MPSNAKSGTIQVDNGSGPGNPYSFRMLFAPTFEAGLVAQEGPAPSGPDTTPDFFFSALQTPEFLTTSPRSCAARFLLDHVEVVVDGAEATLEELEVGTQVGSLRAIRTENDRFSLAIRPIIVESATQNKAVLQAQPIGTFTLEKVERENQGPLLHFAFARTEPLPEPIMLDSCFPLQWRATFTDLPVQFPVGELVIALAQMVSSPTESGGAETALSVSDVGALLVPEE